MKRSLITAIIVYLLWIRVCYLYRAMSFTYQAGFKQILMRIPLIRQNPTLIQNSLLPQQHRTPLWTLERNVHWVIGQVWMTSIKIEYPPMDNQWNESMIFIMRTQRASKSSMTLLGVATPPDIEDGNPSTPKSMTLYLLITHIRQLALPQTPRTAPLTPDPATTAPLLVIPPMITMLITTLNPIITTLKIFNVRSVTNKVIRKRTVVRIQSIRLEIFVMIFSFIDVKREIAVDISIVVRRITINILDPSPHEEPNTIKSLFLHHRPPTRTLRYMTHPLNLLKKSNKIRRRPQTAAQWRRRFITISPSFTSTISSPTLYVEWHQLIL